MLTLGLMAGFFVGALVGCKYPTYFKWLFSKLSKVRRRIGG